MPYIEITKMNNAPRSILVLITANISKPHASLKESIWETVNTIAIKISKISNENNPNVVVNMKNQNDKPDATAIDLKRGDDNSILYRIDKRYQTSLSQCSNSN